jgi:hypothetical protein
MSLMSIFVNNQIWSKKSKSFLSFFPLFFEASAVLRWHALVHCIHYCHDFVTPFHKTTLKVLLRFLDAFSQMRASR